LALLQDLFRDVIEPPFFQSIGRIDDKDITQHLGSRFPTIYHLRRHLMTTSDPIDIRQLYLACHHIIKYRGHFLHDISDIECTARSFDDTVGAMFSSLNDAGIEVSLSDPELFRNILCDDSLTVMERKRVLSKSITSKDSSGTDVTKALCDLLSGSRSSLSRLFDDPGLKGISISFDDQQIERTLQDIETILDPGRMDVILRIRNVYDMSKLQGILSGSQYISDHRVKQYEQHRDDLRILKSAVRQYAPGRYHTVFRKSDVGDNYCSYVGSSEGVRSKYGCDRERFCKYLENIFSNTSVHDDPYYDDMMERISNRTFMPKQNGRENSVIPNHMYHIELELILENASKQFPFLSGKDGSGLSVKERILQLHTFRVPYYVGPLGKGSKNSWAVRRSNERITPWNFDSVIDVDATMEAFIDHYTNDCQYIEGEKVLPKDSIIHSRFKLLDELNNICIDGCPIPTNIKHSLIKDLFLRGTSVSRESLLSYLEENRIIPSKDHRVSGMGTRFRNTLGSEHILRGILHDKANDLDLCESIVRIIVIFRERQRITERLTAKHGDVLTDKEIDSLSGLRFDGWSDVSKRFLTEIYNECGRNGRRYNILEMLEHTDMTFDELLGEYYKDTIGVSGISSYDDLERFNLSPWQKRAVWRAIVIVKDVIDCLGHPERVFFQTVHNPERIAPERSVSPRNVLLDAMSRSDIPEEWTQSVRACSDRDLRSRNLFLYFSQLGRCMYCGREIHRDELYRDSVNRDHIFPSSRIWDDDIHNNLVLCCPSCNNEKGNSYPVQRKVQVRMQRHWDMLRDAGLITMEKYNRLMRTDTLSERELSDAIDMWRVDDDRMSRALEAMLSDVSDEVYHVSPDVISQLRVRLDEIRSPAVNDIHHAKDAYLAIVAGNVFLTKFTDDPKHVLNNDEYYNLGRMYSGTVSRNGHIAWDADSEGICKKYLRRNDVLLTRFPVIQNGELFDDTLQRAGENLFDRKRDMPATIYGGYQKERGACYSLIEYDSNGTSVRSIEVLQRHSVSLLNDKEALGSYYSKRKGADVRVIIPLIRMHSQMEWNGFPLFIGGRTNQSIVFSPGLQLLLPYDLQAYCRHIHRFATESRLGYARSPDYYDLTSERNVDLLDHIIEKCGKSPYSKVFGTFRKNLSSVRNRFMRSDVSVQTEVLASILKVFGSDPSTANLSKVGGPASTGRIILNSRLPNASDGIFLINTSPSGLRENRVRIDGGDVRI